MWPGFGSASTSTLQGPDRARIVVATPGTRREERTIYYRAAPRGTERPQYRQGMLGSLNPPWEARAVYH
jgi:hypothetical protein